MSIFKLKAETVTAQRKTDLPDLDMVKKAITLFGDPGHNFFVMAMPSKAWACYSPLALDHLCSFIGDSGHGRSMYFCINPVGEVSKPAVDSDIIKRRWLFIDVDRNKTLQPNDPATEQEHKDAEELAEEIATWLSADAGFPAPVVVDSGNGFHLYYRIDLPNDKASKNLIRDVLGLLDSTFSDIRGDVGAECHDAKRFSRIPGTWSRRGEKSKTRPYRMAQFASVPDKIEIVSEATLRTLAGGETEIKGVGSVPPTIAPSPRKDPLILKVGPEGDEARKKAYAKKAIDEEVKKIANAIEGERNNQLNRSAFSLFQLVAGGLANSDEVQDAVYEAASQCGLESVEIVTTVESARKAGMKTPRTLPEDKPHVNGQSKKTENENAEKVIVHANEIKTRKVEWIWQGRIPRGKLTTFAGQGGLGKTFVLNDIASRISKGDAWPDGSPGNKPAKVLYVSGEDEPDDTLVPRMIACGADLNNISFFTPKVLGVFSLANIELLDKAVDQMGGNVLLVCIDPPTAYLDGIDDHKNSELRGVLSPLSAWASERRLAVVFISHINKAQGAKIDAAARVIGSVAWVNGVRAAYLFAKDPDNPDERIFVSIKNNLAKEKKGLRYRLESIDQADPDSLAKVIWLGDADTSADEAVNSTTGSGRRKSAGERAAAWMIERFREKLEWDSAELFKAGKEENISKDAIYAAKDILDIPKARKETRLGGHVVWVWWVPENWGPLSPPEQNEEPGEF